MKNWICSYGVVNCSCCKPADGDTPSENVIDLDQPVTDSYQREWAERLLAKDPNDVYVAITEHGQKLLAATMARKPRKPRARKVKVSAPAVAPIVVEVNLADLLNMARVTDDDDERASITPDWTLDRGERVPASVPASARKV